MVEERMPLEVSKKEEPQKNFLEVVCPYCAGTNFVKRGTRKKKNEVVQLYLCRDCQRTFTPGSTKGKHYPMNVILDAMSLYYLGYSLEEACKIASSLCRSYTEIDSKCQITATALLSWLEQYRPLCAFARMRPFAAKMFSPKDIISSATLAHRQLYRFRHHRAKTILIIKEDWKHSRFWPLKDFLDLVPVECPHQYFSEGLRASEAPITFSKTEMIVRGKNNYANKLAKFVLESVSAAKDRHDALQRFMIANDTVTVATEVPVYIRREDLAHMQTQLGFSLFKKEKIRKSQITNDKSPINSKIPNSKSKKEEKELEEFNIDELPKLITGHIDFVQVRNGQIHILDYKPNAAKERPIEQLTIYALALSRLTGLKVFNFKCAWFDERDYFEFYPLHVVWKGGKRVKRRKKVQTIEGLYKINENPKRVEKIRAGK